MNHVQPLEEEILERVQRDTFTYFLEQTHPETGLLADNTAEGAPSSIAAVGMALTAYPVGVERGYVGREEAARRARRTLRFFHESPHSEDPRATGYRGFYYHFLDMETGARHGTSELSTVDTAILLAGALVSAAYFDRDTPLERDVRALADALYRRADWNWACHGGPVVSHGWRPERGFLRFHWRGYNEALFLYILGLGSPTHPLPRSSYDAWTETYTWKRIYDIEFLYAGPLFIHQMSHQWIDFRGIQDAYMHDHGIDYFENTRRATYVQQRYAMRNPRGFRGYNEHCWGITASAGPGPAVATVDGVRRKFFGYAARGVPYGRDDGTLAPWAATASLPFAPEVVLPTLHHVFETYPEMVSEYGITCSFNPTFPQEGSSNGWVSAGYYGLDQGPVISMIENYRTGLIWRIMRRCPYIETGLRRAGFTGGRLGRDASVID